jgi:hypothetical protein
MKNKVVIIPMIIYFYHIFESLEVNNEEENNVGVVIKHLQRQL